jgi:predicted transcriptional regulator/gamma-glutamylcysteine synthetase
MGSLSVKPIDEARNTFSHQLLQDIEALDYMVTHDLFEKEHQRIGAEQELVIIKNNGQPAMIGPDLLPYLPKQFTTEIGQYNLEINLDPFELDGEAFKKTENQLRDLINQLEKVAHNHKCHPFLTGILPTLRGSHLDVKNMAPQVRYKVLSDVIRKIRGEDFEIHIQGAEELIARLDSVMYESCNTSWQLHLQLDPKDFVEYYNWAQYIAGPVLAVTANSPLLFGRELWHETRIALFQQSIDTRSSTNHLRDKRNRVGFGNQWLKDSPTAFFKDNISRFPAILTGDITEQSMEVIREGGIPKLKALHLHNGTVYTWNRPCYGISDTGYPHLRIENRYIPSGPTISDAMANMAFWVGLMKGMPERYAGLNEDVPFQVARSNFYRAARSSLYSVFNWDKREVSASKLLLEKLVPMAEKGLQEVGVDQQEINKYLGIIERRAILRSNGSSWMIKNFRQLSNCYGKGVAVQELTLAMLNGQRSGKPVHEWDNIDCDRVFTFGKGKTTVGRVMKTDLFTIHEEEPLELVSAIMKWKKIRHLPVEDLKGQLVGLISRTNLESIAHTEKAQIARDIMTTELITIPQEMTVGKASLLLKEHGIGCLPVVYENQLIGLLTNTDFKEWFGEDY